MADLQLDAVMDVAWSEQELEELRELTDDGPLLDDGFLGVEGKGKTKVARAERNREHARKSRARKKLLIENVQRCIKTLTRDNKRLREAIRGQLGALGEKELRRIKLLTEDSEEAYTTGEDDGNSSGADSETIRVKARDSSRGLLSSTLAEGTRLLNNEDYALLTAIKNGKQNFLVTDPSLPDNPIVFASAGFMTLTGYSHEEIMGRNCRFLQGSDTDPVDVQRIRDAISEGTECSVVLLNYRKDGTTFWNQFFISPLRGADGKVVNYVGVQQVVTPQVAALLRAQARGDKSAIAEEISMLERGERCDVERRS